MNENFFDQLNNQAFNSYDPSQDTYDPDMLIGGGARAHGTMQPTGAAPANRLVQSRPQQSKGGPVPAAEFTLNIASSATTTACLIELFSAQWSIAEIAKPSLPLCVPILSATDEAIAGSLSPYIYYGRSAAAGDQLSKVYVYWDVNGNLIYNYLDAGGSPVAVTISCNEAPYRQILAYNKVATFSINRIRMVFAGSNITGQIGQNFQLTKTNFLGADTKQTLSISTNFTPDQFQSNRLDMQKTLKLDAERGILYNVLAGQSIQMICSIGTYTKPAF